jgi:ribosomal protein S12 methylthiotransferase
LENLTQKTQNNNIALISLGCPKNLIDSEIMLGILRDAGYNFTQDPGQADVVIVNTCTFIEEATSESIQKLLEISKNRKDENVRIIAAGCMAQRYAEKIFEQFPEVFSILGTGNLKDIVKAVESKEKGKYDDDVDSFSCFLANRSVSTPLSFAYLRIAEGCDKKCTYCIIPALRGRMRTRAEEDILAEATALIRRGYYELVLTAEDTAAYGDLAGLLYKLNDLEGDFKIRLLYCYPDGIDDGIIKAIKECDKVINYIDIPIQHISDKVLKKMNRTTGSDEIKDIIEKLRKEMEDITIRTSLIVGFFGEGEKEFKELCDFVQEYRLDHVGVFTYSKEQGTPAFKMKDPVPKSIARDRREKLMLIQKKIVTEKNNEKIGKIFSAVVDGISDDGLFYEGRIYSQAPEIDTVTYITGLKDLAFGDKVDIKIVAVDDYDLIGEIIYEPSK